MLACNCHMWTNCIFWERENVKVIVEVTEKYRCVTVVTSMENVMKSCIFYNNVIKTVLKLSEMHSFKCEKYFIAPSNEAKAYTLPVRERILYNIKDVARSVLAKCDVSDDNNTNNVDIKQIVGVHDLFLHCSFSDKRAFQY